MELLQLRYFRTAARLENFSEAAKIHLVPQPAISKTIRKLEDELGCSLFFRQGKKVILNSAGKAFLRSVEIALDALDKGVQNVSAMQQPLSLYPQAGIRFMAQLATDYWIDSKHQITLLSYSDLTSRKGQYDLTVMHLLPDMSGYEYEVLMKDEICLAVSPSHPYAARRQISLAELADELFVGFDVTNPLRQLIDDFLEEHGLSAHYVFETFDAALFRSMLSGNAGIGLVPRISWQQTPSNTVLVPLVEKKYRTLVIAWKKGKGLSPQGKSFCQFACRWFEEKGRFD